MKTNEKGKLIKYWVNDAGIHVIDEDHFAFNAPSDIEPVFHTFEDAAIFSILVLSSRIAELEAK